MRGRFNGFTKLGAVVLLVAALAFTGCSDNSVLGPQEPEAEQLNRLVLNPVQALSTVEVDSKVINPASGDVILIDREDYQHSFEVVPGGIDESEYITVKSQKEDVKRDEAITFEFGPDGLVFNEASKLVFEMAEINPDARTAKLYYYDPKVGDWVVQAEKEVRDGIVIFEIYHFSKYAISD